MPGTCSVLHKGSYGNLKQHAQNLLTSIHTLQKNIVVPSVSRCAWLVNINYWASSEQVSPGISGEDGTATGIAWC